MTDGEFVTVLLEGVEPIFVLAIPRAAVLSDQQGDYVYVVDAQNKAEVRRIQLGQSTPSTAVVTNGLQEGELVISEGLQRVRPDETVTPGPASPPPAVRPRLRGVARMAQRAPHRPAKGSGGNPPDQPQAGGSEPMISAIFVDRPRLAVVIAVVITIAGALALLRIPVAQFPDIVPPQVGFRRFTRRFRGRRRSKRRPADRGAGRRRRQDDLHEVDKRQ